MTLCLKNKWLYSKVIYGGAEENFLAYHFKRIGKSLLSILIKERTHPFSKQFSAASQMLLEMYNLYPLVVLKFALG